MKTRHEDEIRDSVRQAYARAVTASGPGACSCGCSGTGGSKGVAARFAGYGEKELSGVPQDAAASSFGCGNPVALSQIQQGQVVLDLGSGAGLDLILAAQKVGPKGRVIGVDMTPEMVERANDNLRRAGLRNAEVRKGLIEDMPVESDTVDWVISNCVINLSPQKSRVFGEIYRVLKPGGRMLVSDIMVKGLPDWVRKDQALYESCIGGAISEEEYVDGLKKARMARVEVMSRLVYNAEQMGALVDSEVAEGKAVMTCCGKMSTRDIGELASKAAADLQGKVWSATVYAEKPVGAAGRVRASRARA